MNRRLYRSPDDRVLAGVAGGMAETYELDPALVRVGWALLILVTGGVFLVLYIIMALVVPLRQGAMGLWAAAGPGGADPAQGGMSAGPGTDPGTSRYPSGSYGPPRRGRSDATGPLVIGLILIVVGVVFLARQFIPAINMSLVWPVIVIAGGALLILVALARPGRQA